MKFGEEIGPREVVIPEQRFYSCMGCKYYSHTMVRSGMHPIYSTTCKKLDTFGKEVSEDDIVLENYRIGERTPDCCPFLKSVKRNDKIDGIL